MLMSLTSASLCQAFLRYKQTAIKRGAAVINRWCNPGHITVKCSLSSAHIQQLALSFPLSYLLRGFTSAILPNIYILTSAVADTAGNIIRSASSKLQTSCFNSLPDALHNNTQCRIYFIQRIMNTRLKSRGDRPFSITAPNCSWHCNLLVLSVLICYCSYVFLSVVLWTQQSIFIAVSKVHYK